MTAHLKTIHNQVLALAGVYQACHQVKTLAWKGQCQSEPLNTAIGSIFKINADNIDDVYGGNHKLESGLHLLASQFNPDALNTDVELTRYTLNLFALEKKLSKSAQMLAQIAQAIESAKVQLSHYGTEHPNTWSALAEIYQNTVSTLNPRIMVSGEQSHLSNNTNVTKIRSLLLAAIRSVVLWRQCGGSRFSFLLNRRNYYHEANNVLASK